MKCIPTISAIAFSLGLVALQAASESRPTPVDYDPFAPDWETIDRQVDRGRGAMCKAIGSFAEQFPEMSEAEMQDNGIDGIADALNVADRTLTILDKHCKPEAE
ncbi:MAG: hypothetical protein OXQ29_07905 [Rhodospirillaceae bacterium]|nr:hypothetical protein [Rhodospirillaceae bacterium]